MRIASLVAVVLVVSACGGKKSSAKAEAVAVFPPKTEDAKTAYAVGLLLGKDLKDLKLSPLDVEYVKAGLADRAVGKTPQVDFSVYGPKALALTSAKQVAEAAAAANAQKAKDAAFVDEAAKEPGATKLESGVILKVETKGKGKSPKPTDKLRVSYEGTLTDGSTIASEHGADVHLAMSAVSPCWAEALPKMKVGETAQVVCPAAVAGEAAKAPGVPAGATLVYKLSLLELNPKDAKKKKGK